MAFPPTPVTVNGVEYASYKEAVAATGIQRGRIRRVVQQDGPRVFLQPESRYRVPVTINGVTYESQSAAAKALGVTRQWISTVYHRSLVASKKRGTADVTLGAQRDRERLKRVWAAITRNPRRPIRDIAHELNLSYSTCRRDIQTLEGMGYITRPAGTNGVIVVLVPLYVQGSQ
jgi:hypothetical protein